MLIFDKELKVLPAAGHRDPGGTFFVIPQGPSLFFTLRGTRQSLDGLWSSSGRTSSPTLDAPSLESWSEG